MIPRTLALCLAIALPSAAGAANLPAPLADTDYMPLDMDEVRLGQLLFYDPILSGNRNIACATCHHPRFATGDGLSLGLGEGGVGLGPERRATAENTPEQLIPRNSPALFNLGVSEIPVMFADGRIQVDPNRPSGLRTPLEDEMIGGFANLLSAQTMFPVLSPDEMAGHYSENDVSRAVRSGRITGEGGAWNIISDRVAALPEYRAMFEAAYPDIAAGRDIGFTDISNAIAAFVAFEWRSDTSPFDAALRGDAPLEGLAAEGAELFYGKAGCASCHEGPLLTDFGFHAMAQPQLGPGKAERFEAHQRDIGRMRVTGDPDDAYRFRTPSLRNVTRTGPWGHAGAFTDLTAFLRHHAGARQTGPLDVTLPGFTSPKPIWTIAETPDESAAILAAAEPATALDEEEIAAILAFLESLEDPAALSGRLGIPASVPSGLPVDR